MAVYIGVDCLLVAVNSSHFHIFVQPELLISDQLSRPTYLL